MLALTGLFAWLGVWQMQRLAEKEALIAAVAERFDRPPTPLPPVAEWVGFDPEVYDYRPVSFRGRYLYDRTALVFTSLSEPRGRFGGPGYWVMTPVAIAGGGTVFVNRGFVPEQLADSYLSGGTGPVGEVEVTGIARKGEAASAFTPGPDATRRIEWVRDPARLAAFLGPEAGPVAPIYVDLPAGDPGALPQGGETVVEFPNNHFGYALTWFGFALLTPALLAFWIARQLRRPQAGEGDHGGAPPPS
jgi:surfeit locus 1 family protein